MAENKKACAPVEEESRDYNELGLRIHSKGENSTLKAAQALWDFLPAWMAARKMAIADPKYNRAISGYVAQNAKIVLKAAQEMAEWAEKEPEEDD